MSRVLLDELLDRVGEVVSSRERLTALLQTVVGIGGDLDLRSTLHRIVTAACTLSGVRFPSYCGHETYAALGVVRDGRLVRFLQEGMDADTVKAIGALPEGKGLLGRPSTTQKRCG